MTHSASTVRVWTETPRRDNRRRLHYRASWHERQPDGTLRRRRESLWNYGVRTRPEAEAWCRDKMAELNGGTVKRQAPLTAAEAFRAYLDYQRPRWRARTHEAKVLLLRQFEKFCGAQTLIARVTGQTIQAFLSNRAKVVSPATHDRDLRDLRAAFGRLLKPPFGFLRENPCDGIEPFRVEPKREAALTIDNCLDIVQAAFDIDGLWGIFAAILVETGMRRNEVAFLEWPDVAIVKDGERVTECRLRVHVKEAFGRKNRGELIWPLSAFLAAQIETYRAWLSGQGLIKGYAFRPWVRFVDPQFGGVRIYQWKPHHFGKVAARVFAEAYKAAGAPARSKPIHSLRQAFATDAARMGVRREVLARGAGWASMGVIEKSYDRTDQEAAAMEIHAKRGIAEALAGRIKAHAGFTLEEAKG